MRFLLIALAMLSQVPTTSFPSAEISNGRIRATILLPDAEKGYYRGTRFDWSGVISSLNGRATSTSASGSPATTLSSTTRSWGRSRSS